MSNPIDNYAYYDVCFNGNHQVAAELLENPAMIPVSEYDENDNNIVLSIERKNVEAIETLLARKEIKVSETNPLKVIKQLENNFCHDLEKFGLIEAHIEELIDNPNKNICSVINNKNGFTPLHYAVKKQNVLLVKKLLSKIREDGQPEIKFFTDEYCRTPLMLAKEHGNQEIVDLLSNQYHPYKVVEAFYGRGVDIDTAEKYATDPFQLVNERDENNETVLHKAAVFGLTNLVELLLSRHDIQTQPTNDEGYTPLHLAVLNGYTDIVKLFIDKKVDLELAHEEHGDTALDFAREEGKQDIVDLLLEAGAK